MLKWGGLVLKWGGEGVEVERVGVEVGREGYIACVRRMDRTFHRHASPFPHLGPDQGA